jgi:hypothetical protein
MRGQTVDQAISAAALFCLLTAKSHEWPKPMDASHVFRATRVSGG